jgi:glycosyltransferase involved in cell wall biosynthesis
MDESTGRSERASARRGPRPTLRPGGATQSSSSVRVLWLVKGLGPGGAERLLVSAACISDHRTFEIDAAFVDPTKSQLAPALTAAGVPTHCIGDVGGRPWAWIPALRELLVAGHYDVVHVHSPLIAAVARVVVRTMPKAGRPNLVSTEHNVWSAFSPATRVLNAITWGADDAHLAVSEEVRRSVRPRRRSGRVEVVVHGIDLGPLEQARGARTAARASLGIGPNEILIGTVANYRSHKAYPDLFAAATEVLERDDRVRFLAVGQGPLQAEIEAEHERLGFGDRFLLYGYSADPLSLLAACDVFVLASHFEGYPVALMEALGIGLPVVATAVGGIPDAVHDGVEGILVPPRRPDRLAAALLQFARDPEQRAAFAAGALRRGQHFDIRHAVERIQDIYVQLVEDGR